ncbi:MAG: hypothetical protein RLZZ65_627 [Bacteroidota bacterium]|jgi:hypothetical protein
MRLFLLFALLACHLPARTQTIDWQWGEFYRSKGQLLQVLPNNGPDFKTVHTSTQFGGGQYVLTKYEGLSPNIGAKIKPVTPSGFGYYQQCMLLGNNTYVFIADREGKEMKLYVKQLDAELNEIDVREVANYTENNPNPLPNFSIIQSPDFSHFAIFYNIPGRHNGVDTYGFRVYDADFQIKCSSEYSLPFDAKLSSIEDFLLTNDGILFVGVIELGLSENQTIKTRKVFKNLHIYELSRDQIKDFTFELDSKRITNLILNSDGNNSLTVFGLYSHSEWMDAQDGYFNAQIDLQLDSAVSIGYIPFSKEIMLNEHNAAERMRLERRMERRSEDPQLSRYELRDIFTLPDGSYVGSIEKFYIYNSINFSSQTGQPMTYTYYYYNDIVAFCIDAQGQLKWEQRIPKRQYSINDYGPYSSYASFLGGNQQLYFIFNDTEVNYDTNGQFLANKEVQTFSISKNRNVGALVQIDLQTGNLSRSIVHQRKDENTLLVPKAFTFDRKNNGLYTYGIYGPQEKFGYLHFQP